MHLVGTQVIPEQAGKAGFTVRIRRPRRRESFRSRCATTRPHLNRLNAIEKAQAVHA